MITRAELQRLANREKVALGTLEKDYILTEVLKGLSNTTELSKIMIFKGGTALRKVYYPDWRYSEDLDFTAKREMAKEQLRKELGKWYQQVEQDSGIRLTIKMLHKPNGYARVRVQFNGPLDYPGMIFFDISFDETICLEPEYRTILYTPFLGGDEKVLAYPLEELLSEKMRSLLERGKSRDYYDVWRLLKEKSSTIDFDTLGSVLLKKISHKGLSLEKIDDFFPKDLPVLKRYWEKDLGHQIIQLPPLFEVLDEIRKMMTQFLVPYLGV